MRATNSIILAIYNYFEYYLFDRMAKKHLDYCWFYDYIEECNDLGIFYFKAVDKLDPSISCKVRIAIDKYMYKYHDELVGIFQSHVGWIFDTSNYNYDRHRFDIIFEKDTCYGIHREVFSVSDEGITVKYIPLLRDHPILSMDEINYVDTDMRCVYETYYKDIYRKIANDRALKNALNYVYGLPGGKEQRASMDNVSCYISTKSYLGGFNPLPTFTPVPALSKPPIFNPPATICYWNDGTKTVVKCQKGDTYSPEAGLALCYMKKVLGNTSKDLNKELHKYIPEKKNFVSNIFQSSKINLKKRREK